MRFSLLMIALLLTACGKSFQSVAPSIQGELGASNLDGGRLYAAKCASCHEELVRSTKIGRSAEQIKFAVAGVPQMRSALANNLSDAEIELISRALSSAPIEQANSKFSCTSPEARGLGERYMKRLVRSELVNTLTELLGSDVLNDSAIRTQLQTLPEDLVRSGVTDVAPSPSDGQPMALLNIALRSVELARSSASLRNRFFGSCSSTLPATETCARTFITNFGKKVYRRPLKSEEVELHVNHFKKAGAEGLNQLLMRFLLSPALAFHVELGSMTEGQRVRLTDHEVASRISYRIAGTAPDSELMSAADRGELRNLASVRNHTKRILETHPLAKNKLSDFFKYYTQADQSPNPFAGASQLLGIDGADLNIEMAQETAEFINHVVWAKKGGFKDLYTSREVFPRSDRMAKILETNKINGNIPAITPPSHAGLLLRPSFLAGSGATTQPYHRAAAIRKGILCEVLGSPDAEVVSDRAEDLGDLSSLSNRDRLTALTNTGECLSCHSKLNPIGFSLEGYDQLGAKRSVESVFRNGAVVGTHPINTQVDRTYLKNASGDEIMSLNNSLELVEAVISGIDANACFAKKVFEFQRIRESLSSDHCALSEVENISSAQTSVLDVFIHSVGNEDIFWKAKGE